MEATQAVLSLLRRNREFRRLYLAHGISRAGDAFNTIAVIVLAFTLTGSGRGVAGAVIFEVLPVLLIGDFNAAAGANKAYEILTDDKFFTDAWMIAGERRGEGINTFIGFRLAERKGVRIDWILARGDVTVAAAETLPYAPDRDFAPVGLIGWAPNLVLVRKGLADSVAALIEAARSASPPLRYASAGTGQTIHLSAALFERMAGVRMAHVPFETGSAAGLAALVRGEVDVMFDNILGCRDTLRRGVVRALAVAGSLRSSALPDLPTLDECGLSGYRADIWLGLFAPGETPADVLSELRRALGVVLGQTDVVAHLREAGLMLDFCSGDEFSEEVAANRAAWQSLIESCEPR